MKFYLTTTVKKSGGSSLCVYVPSSWRLMTGADVNVEIRKAEAGERDPVFTFIASVRAASTAGGQKITVPKLFGLTVGDWITISLQQI